MPTKSDAWRQSLGAAFDKVTPVGARLVQSLENLALGGPQPAPAVAAATTAAAAAAGDLNAQLYGWSRDIDQSIRRPAQVGIWMFAVFIVGLGLWATTAPLSSAIVAHGSFVATGQNKVVQHLEGGLIRSILVKEGDKVQAGQALIEMDDTASRADEQRYAIRQATLLATKARIEAERDGTDTIAYPPQLTAMAGNPEVAKSIEAQQSLFATRRTEFQTQREINERQIAAIQHEIEGLQAQKAANEEQLALTAKEAESAEQLLVKGLTEKGRVLDLQRNRARLAGDVGQFVSEIGKAEQRILETRSQLNDLRSKFFIEDADLYRQTQAELSDTEQRLTASRSVLDRHIIRAPTNGVIVKMNYHTAGGVIPPSQVVLEILPTDEKLIVEAMVRPEEIQFVQVGQAASVRLSALNQRTTPLIEGTVNYVSADKIQNPMARAPGSDYFYLVRVELDEASIRDRIGKVKIAPGMPGEVYMKTGERTMWQYLTRPIVDVMYRGGREQ